MCAISNVNGTYIFTFDQSQPPQQSHVLPAFTSWWQFDKSQLFYKDHCNIVKTTWNSWEKQDKICYQAEPGYPATSPVACLRNGSLYYSNYNKFYLFDGSESPLITKQIDGFGDPKFLKQGGDKIYLQGSYKNLGSRLMQYDTLGNQKWSLPIGLLVYGMYADKEGNCYMLTSEVGGIGHVQKYNAKGELVYDVKLPGQRGTNAFKSGDSLFVCGQVSGAVRVEGQKMAAFCIISVRTGEVYYQQTLNLDPEPIHQEDFTQIVSDGKNVYVGGYYGGQNKTSVLVKYSKEGNTTGFNDTEITKTSFNIFPNPGGRKFTISCGEAAVKTLQVTVRNIAGKVVYDNKLNCNAERDFTLDLGKQPAGNYTVEIGSGKGKTTKKIIVE